MNTTEEGKDGKDDETSTTGSGSTTFAPRPTFVINNGARRKILCLHGGGSSPNDFRNEPGMIALEQTFPNYEFVYPQAPYVTPDGVYVWIQDPAGGKENASTGLDVAAESFSTLDRVIAEQGPFWGLLGFSQGGAFVSVYLAHATVGTFEMAVMFSGYPTETHQGLLDLVAANSPYGDIPALSWSGENDGTIGSGFSAGQAATFTNPVIVVDPQGDHHPPLPTNPTWNQVVEFIASGLNDVASTTTIVQTAFESSSSTTSTSVVEDFNSTESPTVGTESSTDEKEPESDDDDSTSSPSESDSTAEDDKEPESDGNDSTSSPSEVDSTADGGVSTASPSEPQDEGKDPESARWEASDPGCEYKKSGP